MIKFIKKLLFGTPTTPAKHHETVKEILTPPAKAPYKVEPASTTIGHVPPAPVPKPVNKVKAIGETGANAVKAATALKPANKKRRPYRGNKNAGGSLAKVGVSPSSVTEGATKGGNSSVKQTSNQPKPAAPKAPTVKKK